MSLYERVARFIDVERLLTPGAKVVVGLSGGADSSALLVVLCRLGYDCVAVHCHFGLRGEEADRDLAASEALAHKLGVGFSHVRFDTRDYMRRHCISAEMACRELRYDYFERVRCETGAEAIAVGHHREDNVETFFLNLLRGSGLHGLRAMLPHRGHIVRPLLAESKSEILAFLESEGIDYVTDSTNADNDFRRNRIRNVVMPALEQAFPGATAAIGRSINCLRGNERLYNSLLPPRGDSLEGATPTLLHEWFAPFGFNSDQCERMCTALPGATFESDSYMLTLCRGKKYELKPLDEHHSAPKLTARTRKNDKNFRPAKGVLYLDADALPPDGDWKLRRCVAGDRMKPYGMVGRSKLVADILAEAGVPASARKNKYVLTLNGVILWAVGFRTSALYPVTENTDRIIEIHYEDI